MRHLAERKIGYAKAQSTHALGSRTAIPEQRDHLGIRYSSVELIHWKPRAGLAWITNKQSEGFPREQIISRPPFIPWEDLGFSFLLTDRDLTGKRAELHQEPTVA